MTERRTWTPQQDKALKYLRDVLKVPKWSQISRKLEFQYHLPERNGKQCRQRYTNHLADQLNFTQFSLEEEQRLFRLHNLIGNKWSQICKDFSGRTQNQMKNHFHSKLRKAIRKLNKQIKLNFKKTIKPYKLSIVYKIVEGSDLRFSSGLCLDQENLKFFNNLKNYLIQFAGGSVQQKSQISSKNEKEQVNFLVSQLVTFQNHLKHNKVIFSAGRKNKKIQNNKVYSSPKINLSTQNSELSESALSLKQVDESSESQLIYEEMSFQFIVDPKLIDKNLPIMEQQQINSHMVEKAERNDFKGETKNMTGKRFNIFQNNQNLLQKSVPKFSDIINSMAEQKQFSGRGMDKKFSVKSFESLKEYQDNYLNDSEINMMMKRFDSFSNMESRLFQ